MNRKLLIATLSLLTIASCNKAEDSRPEWIERALDVATYQLNQSAIELKESHKMPRSTYTGYDLDFLCEQMETTPDKFTRKLATNETRKGVKLCEIYDWTSGFFPGSMWYTYEMTGDERLKEQATHYTKMLNPLRNYRKTHDIGFMVNCSFGNALRIAPQDSVKRVIIETADNLCTRFNPQIGAIRSWDFGEWNYPVIIDNMMNLDLLFNASKLSGDRRYYDVATAHAKTTLKNHFRPDYTSYHVVSYNDDGSVECRNTHQGKSDDSSWTRGQAWGLYGYVLCYRESKDPEFLAQAVNIANMIMERNTPSDKVPYWDFDAPEGDDTPRDASAGAIMASAMFELSGMVDGGSKYFDYAEQILKSLSSNQYLAEKGENYGYILKHSVGSLPHGSEIDTPINYADYYYLEAIKRYLDLL